MQVNAVVLQTGFRHQPDNKDDDIHDETKLARLFHLQIF